MDKEKAADSGDKHYKFMSTAEELYRDPAGARTCLRPAQPLKALLDDFRGTSMFVYYID